ncbi:OB-fold-containig protein [Mangrovihabitans endophyticus]|uniref:DUF1449 family protein n=1 Tax=Mangrovihabitans endophyticus TaxID=1751298 RepID=A0A8J3C448_9ACTN|nr:OB-fold-containig protein [Mangrovihabitans endophyticus]GGL05566.1 hypothetical protein GCM10012284_45000 [Mangrovihabitans endophyticus]
MGGFVDAVLSFPTIVFTPLLVVVVGYWIVVIVGGADPDADIDTDALGFAGLAGVPVPVVVSLLVAFAWFGSLAGTQLLPVAGWLVLLAALVAAWLLTRLALTGLKRVWPTGTAPSRADFIGLTCVIRTGRVTDAFGQAEVHARDGSSALVQVRQAGHDDLGAGTVALLYDVDPDGEFFWVVPADVALRPDTPPSSS